MRSRRVAGVQPQVLGPRHAERQVVVLARVAADEHGQPAAAQVVAGPGAGVAVPGARFVRATRQLARVARVQHERFGLARREKRRACLAQAQVDLVARPLDAPRLFEQALGVGEAPEAGIEGDDERAPGVGRVRQLDGLPPRLGPAGEGEKRPGPAPQVGLVGEPREVLREVRLQLLQTPDLPAPLVEGVAAAALELEAAAARLEKERPRLEPGRGPQRDPRGARELDRGERDRRRVDEVDVVPRVRRPRYEERRRRVAESPAKLDERGGASVRLAREPRAEAGTGGEDRAHEGSALGPRRGHGRLEGRGVDMVPLALRRLRQGPGLGSLAEAADDGAVAHQAQRGGGAAQAQGQAGVPGLDARRSSPRPRGRGRRRGRRRGACAGAAAPGASGREPRGASARRGTGRRRAAASRRRPWRVRRPARASGRASPGRRRPARSPRRGGASRGTGRPPAGAARRGCARG